MWTRSVHLIYVATQVRFHVNKYKCSQYFFDFTISISPDRKQIDVQKQKVWMEIQEHH